MASNSGFTDQLPSATSKVADGDNEFRQLKTFMKNWWEQEHYGLDGSANSAGVHKNGSARAFIQAAAPTTDVVKPIGQVWMDKDIQTLYVHDGTSWLTSGLAGTKLHSFKTYVGVWPDGMGALNGQTSLLTEVTTTGTAIGDIAFANLQASGAGNQVICTVDYVKADAVGLKLSNISTVNVSASTYTAYIGVMEF